MTILLRRIFRDAGSHSKIQIIIKWVDLIIQLQKRTQTRSDRVIAIEIKPGKKIRSEWLDFLIRFDSDQKNTTAQRKIIVYNGTTSETRHGIDILPVEVFLTELYQGKIY